ncbi:MAG TPA: hypothetical protein VJ957_11470, partial [Longimicrobiales bacterium]|nr:hypothetical protein [Longimicrobiales bacterium]
RYTVTVRRLDTLIFLMTSRGQVLSGGRYGGATRTLAQVVRTPYFYLPRDRAVQTAVDLRTRGKSGVTGQDTIPPGWTNCDNLGLRTGIVKDSASNLDMKGQLGLEGSPDSVSKKLTSNDLFNYGDLDYDKLRSIADKVVVGTYTGMGPSTTGSGACNKADVYNWGDPNNPAGPCHFYWPIIYAPGDLHLSTGVGQGILLVDGDLDLTGNFEFDGVVVVKGGISFTGSGNKVNGSLNVWGNAGTDSAVVDNKGSGNTVIQFSSCAIERAALYNQKLSRAFPINERSFIDLSGIGGQ